MAYDFPRLQAASIAHDVRRHGLTRLPICKHDLEIIALRGAQCATEKAGDRDILIHHDVSHGVHHGAVAADNVRTPRHDALGRAGRRLNVPDDMVWLMRLRISPALRAAHAACVSLALAHANATRPPRS
eukprot:2029895-Prymnesium_polylepis.1